MVMMMVVVEFVEVGTRVLWLTCTLCKDWSCNATDVHVQRVRLSISGRRQKPFPSRRMHLPGALLSELPRPEPLWDHDFSQFCQAVSFFGKATVDAEASSPGLVAHLRCE